ncbi:lysozyme inhibitor LprI family protein [Labrys sedimenti]|uniref:lysozyme inhibitor LprI family protein n=1 Tax=Labrys sedimenti TaxID=3106036 RepID=UPI002ACAE4B0|nr:lysozyme inhibitor LprI family protein [Labrys sp. ZIDIC5]MDZ5449261.1 lysozyme inhibitor LprI family protein [Labrys sp. ZIDIC5]
MKRLAFGIAALTVLHALPAYAIDCKKASTSIERRICADKSLRRADAAMGAAYARILKASQDPEIRAMLVESQKHWLARRDLRLDQEDGAEGAGDSGEETPKNNLLKAIEARTADLAELSKTDPKLPRLIEIANGQRRFNAQFSGGPFAGYSADCDFLPSGSDQIYTCLGTRTYQNNDRVCSVTTDFATNALYTTQTVAEVVDGKLKTIATCGDENGNSPCPDGQPSADRHWTVQPAASANASATSTPSPKISADLGEDEDSPWLHACLTDKSYPLADPASDGSKK